MLKILTTLTIVAFTTLGFTQDKFTFVLKGQIFNTKGNTMKLLQQDANQKEITVATIKLDDKGFFEQAIALKDKDYYTLALQDGQSINLIIEGNDTIKVYGDGRSLLNNSNIINSEPSSMLLDFQRKMSEFQQKMDSTNQKLPDADKAEKYQLKQELELAQQVFLADRRWFISETLKSPALVGALSTLSVENEFQLYEKLVKELENSFGESPSVQRIVKEYKKNKTIIQSRMPLAPGNEAKEIALPNPSGDTLRLSDYKGKVVLIDFWASWCGPCRRENPNVVKIYNKYHDQGFEVFSVSLDKSKDSWVQAIEQDGLIWDGHVSDLKFWQSGPAKAYGVSSIPFTVLIDKEGKIIGTNLRGEKLANTLKDIFE